MHAVRVHVVMTSKQGYMVEICRMVFDSLGQTCNYPSVLNTSC